MWKNKNIFFSMLIRFENLLNDLDFKLFSQDDNYTNLHCQTGPSTLLVSARNGEIVLVDARVSTQRVGNISSSNISSSNFSSSNISSR